MTSTDSTDSGQGAAAAPHGAAHARTDTWSHRELDELSSYAPGVNRTIEIPEGTAVQVLEQTVERFPHRPALDFMGRTTTYAELHRQVQAGAQVLKDHGVTKGDRVLIVLPTSPQAVVAFYSVLYAGGIVVEQNPLYTADEFAKSAADHGAKVAIVWNKLADTIAGVNPQHQIDVLHVDMTRELPALKQLALRLPVKKARTTRNDMTGKAGVGTSWDKQVARAVKAGAKVAAPDVNQTDVALLQYTGGTTGDPKAAMLTHRNLMANVAQGVAWVPGIREGREVFYAILPLFHAYGMLLNLLCGVRLGACLVLFPRFDVDMTVAAQKRRPCTFMPGVPPIYAKLADRAEQGEVDLSSIKWCLSGAMPLPPELVERWEKYSGGWLIEGYGMTETSPIAAGNPFADSRRPGAVGLPFPSTEVRLRDPDDPTQEVPAGAEGEIHIRGPQVFAGYWNNPEGTAEVLLEDGWLRTGDVAEIDEQGFITIVDRIKDVIITGGFNIYPSQVEDVIRGHGGIADCAVVGIRRPDGNETVVAAVELEPGHSLDEDAVRAYARQHMAGYKVPKEIRIEDELPRNPMGKILRRQLRDRYRAEA